MDYIRSRCVKQPMSTLYAALPPLVSRSFSSVNDLRSVDRRGHVATSSRDAYAKYSVESQMSNNLQAVASLASIYPPCPVSSPPKPTSVTLAIRKFQKDV